ncbi:MAG: dihydrodiol dehydrogenase [Candidatus Carbobacillus altaicus]|uniref:Dihydrodiol dehydrogenase n=1 Tax=Candidatus Carbonibacillus altaicus TaxID=2163959 RepID=A0A2R6XXB7_9BACL|nr:dihydrodiol dehydrogenase [Candidatus Carbobacillus altaicus]PTQ55074.1 MAG: hypothetical protein BSOLF_0580 [Candidatus Carbobacillus altaicus]
MHLDDAIKIANEFTTVIVKKVLTRNGERLEVYSPRLGYRIHLDPLALESLSWQEVETFSKFLETPFGPGSENIAVKPLSDVL